MANFKFQCLNSKKEESGKLTSKFLLHSLSYGQGITIGNALRRVLLSDIKGTAISAIKIPGLIHEFSNLKGIREDALELFLNFKQVVLKNQTLNDSYGEIKIKGPGILTAEHIKFNDPIEVINKNQYLATLTSSEEIQIELKIENGAGYKLGEQTKEKLDGFLAIDSVFMPILQVNFHVNTEYQGNAQNTEFLIMEITTNGSITPSDALSQAAGILVHWFSDMTSEPITKSMEIQTLPEIEKETILIEELQLPVRAYNCLKRVGINSLDDLITYSQEDIKNIKNFGKKSAQDVFTALYEKFNITLPATNTAKI